MVLFHCVRVFSGNCVLCHLMLNFKTEESGWKGYMF